MSNLMTAPVTGTGTSEEVTTALVEHLYDAYLNGDMDGVLLYGELILKELADKPNDPVALATAHLFRGWATMVGAMKAARVDVNLYRAGLQEAMREIESILYILLENEELFAERVAAECYIALIEYHLGNTESGARKLELIQSSLGTRPGVGTKVRGIYMRTMSIIARDFLGVEVPSLKSGGTEPDPAHGLSLQATQVQRKPFDLTDETRQQGAAFMEQRDAHGMLELTNDLVLVDPAKLSPDSWHTIWQWHTWALLTLGEASHGAERETYLTAALPFVQQMADEAFHARHPQSFVALATELTVLLRMLGRNDEADLRWQLVCTFVAKTPSPIREQLENDYIRRSLDRIQNLGLNLASRALPVA